MGGGAVKTGALGGNIAAADDAYPGGGGRVPPAVTPGTAPGIPVLSPAAAAGAALGGGAPMVAPTPGGAGVPPVAGIPPGAVVPPGFTWFCSVPSLMASSNDLIAAVISLRDVMLTAC